MDSELDGVPRTSSVGLLAVRIASAAARRRLGQELNERDIRAIDGVMASLRSEVRVLRGSQRPDFEDESSYAFAGFALGALNSDAINTLDNEEAAIELENLVGELDKIQQGVGGNPAEIERLFLATSRIASMDSGSAGERLEGIPASFGLTR